MDRGGGELTGRGARQRSRARDLIVVAWGARGADGDPYPGWHELVEGLVLPGVGGASSTRRCSGHGGEERGVEMSAVEMVRGVAPFYRVGEAVSRRGGF
jgi:hypothetical protein